MDTLSVKVPTKWRRKPKLPTLQRLSEALVAPEVRLAGVRHLHHQTQAKTRFLLADPIASAGMLKRWVNGSKLQ
jgi:hypothetical protein